MGCSFNDIYEGLYGPKWRDQLATGHETPARDMSSDMSSAMEHLNLPPASQPQREAFIISLWRETVLAVLRSAAPRPTWVYSSQDYAEHAAAVADGVVAAFRKRTEPEAG